MTDVIATLVLIVILGLAIGYIVRQKRRGAKCIGCPAGSQACSSYGAPSKDCECGCSAADKMVADMQNSLK